MVETHSNVPVLTGFCIVIIQLTIHSGVPGEFLHLRQWIPIAWRFSKLGYNLCKVFRWTLVKKGIYCWRELVQRFENGADVSKKLRYHHVCSVSIWWEELRTTRWNSRNFVQTSRLSTAKSFCSTWSKLPEMFQWHASVSRNYSDPWTLKITIQISDTRKNVWCWFHWVCFPYMVWNTQKAHLSQPTTQVTSVLCALHRFGGFASSYLQLIVQLYVLEGSCKKGPQLVVAHVWMPTLDLLGSICRNNGWTTNSDPNGGSNQFTILDRKTFDLYFYFFFHNWFSIFSMLFCVSFPHFCLVTVVIASKACTGPHDKRSGNDRWKLPPAQDACRGNNPWQNHWLGCNVSFWVILRDTAEIFSAVLSFFEFPLGNYSHHQCGRRQPLSFQPWRRERQVGVEKKTFVGASTDHHETMQLCFPKNKTNEPSLF